MALRDSGKGKGLTMTRGSSGLTLPRTQGPSLLEVNLTGGNGNHKHQLIHSVDLMFMSGAEREVPNHIWLKKVGIDCTILAYCMVMYTVELDGLEISYVVPTSLQPP